jgi:ParB-like nuclease domain
MPDSDVATKIPVESVVIDVDWYPRQGFTVEHVRMLRETLAAFPDRDLPPIVVTHDHKLIDGLHRTQAYRDVGRTEIPARVEPERSEAEIWELALVLNNENSTPITIEDRRAIFERMWKHHLKQQKAPMPRLMELFRVSAKTINRWVDGIEQAEKRVRPSAGPRASMEPVRSAPSLNAPMPIHPAVGARPAGTRRLIPTPEVMTRNAFDSLRVCSTYALQEDVTPEGICGVAQSLEDAARSLFLTSLRTGFVKVLAGLEMFYRKDLKREAPWK